MSDTWKWIDSRELCVEGRGWRDTEAPFDRLPPRMKGQVPDIVRDLSRSAAGVTVRFESDAPELRARWELANECLSTVHWPALACSGLDMYARTDDGFWRWIGPTTEIAGRQAEALEPTIGALLN